MNPSYNSGSFSAGGNPGMITSAPDSTVPEPMKLNGGARGGSKKGLLVVGVLLVVLLIVGVIVGVMMGGGRNGNDSSQVIATKDTDFYRYANYILNGKDIANTNLGEYESSSIYSVITEFNEQNVDFFNKAKELWETFFNRIKNDESISEVSELRGSVDYQNELMDFVTKYVFTNDYDTEGLFELYLDEGADKADETIEKNYADLIGTIYGLGKEYAKIKLRNAKTALNLYMKYDSLGCIKDKKVDNDCINDNKSDLKVLMGQYDAEEKDVNDAVLSDAIKMLVENCYMIKNILGGQNG